MCVEEDKSSRIADQVAIYDAIASSDASAARQAMREHFTDLLEVMHAAIEQEEVEAAKRNISNMRKRFSIDDLATQSN